MDPMARGKSKKKATKPRAPQPRPAKSSKPKRRRGRKKKRGGKQVRFPRVVDATGKTARLAYRGLSANNIRNLQKGDRPIFTAQKPDGTASALQHIVDDSEDSGWLSFEQGGLGISAGKYAAKPVDAETKKPRDVEIRNRRFLKQAKSYAMKSRKEDTADTNRIGYVGGILPTAGSERLDVSTEAMAKAHFKPDEARDEEARRKRAWAVKLAKADREVLVKPGRAGISGAQVPFMAKVQEVPREYYNKHLHRQTSTKALGLYKSSRGKPVFHKVQIQGESSYRFAIPPADRRSMDDEDSEMSDIESMNLTDYDGLSDDEGD